VATGLPFAVILLMLSFSLIRAMKADNKAAGSQV